jgi:hypothetical protein
MFQGAVMSSFTNANGFQLWTIGLSIAVTLVFVSLAAFLVFIFKSRPLKVDPLRQHKTEERLSELAETTPARTAGSH